MAVKIFATYSLKRGKPLGPLWAFFYGLGGQPNKLDPKSKDPEGQGPNNNSGQVDPLGLAFPFTQSALGCYGFFMALAACNWNGCAEAYFHSPGLAEISKHHLTSGLNSTGVVSSRRRLPTHLEFARATQVAFGAPCKSIG